jgi:uncharacterized membrane protein (DUF4010 family)
VTDSITLARIAVAALGGAAIGIERQRSGHASGHRARLGGIRTFSLIGGLAGLAGYLATVGLTGIAVVLVAGPVALVIAGYVAASRHDVDATTEAAALVVIAAGFLAGTGGLALASGIIAVTALLLVEKSHLHTLVSRIADEELRAAARFGVMAVVVLPLLPEGPFGPLGGVKPRELWLLVLFFSGLGFAGYLARRVVGPVHGYPLAGALAGVISSTNATFAYARLSRREHGLSGPLATGAIAACTMLFPRVVLAAAVLEPAVATALLPYLVAPFAVGVAAVILSLRRRQTLSADDHIEMPSNPLQILPAIQMAATFQAVMFAVTIARRLAGDRGLLLSGAILGITDVDALTISMVKSVSEGGAVVVAAQAIAIGILVNSAFKLGVAWVFGDRGFRRITGTALAALILAIGVSIGLWR